MSTRSKSSRASPGKTPTTSKPGFPDAGWTARFEAKIESALREVLSETADRIMTELTSIKESLSAFEHRLTSVEAECAKFGVLRGEVLQLKSSLSEVKKQNVATEQRLLKAEHSCAEVSSLRSQLDRFERAEVAADAFLHGIPAQRGEDLTGLFKNICSSIGSAVPAVERMSRVRKSNSVKTDAPIKIKFSTPMEKGLFLKSVAAHNRTKTKLCLRHAGFESDVPIYINECLTKANVALLKAALQLKKQKQLSSAFTRRGQILIKRSHNDAPVLVTNMDMLSDLTGTGVGNTLFRNNC